MLKLQENFFSQNLQGYDSRSDIYSLGITACELANGHVPFKDMPATQVRYHLLTPSQQFPILGSIKSINLSIYPSSETHPLNWNPAHPQMLLEKLNGTVPCLLDTTTIPPDELTLKPSRSGADSGICEGPGAGGVRHSNGEPSSSSGHPYNRTFSLHFHTFVELCLQRDPEKRLVFISYVLWAIQTWRGAAGPAGVTRHTVEYFKLLHFCLFFSRPSATTLIGHPFFKQVRYFYADFINILFLMLLFSHLLS